RLAPAKPGAAPDKQAAPAAWQLAIDAIEINGTTAELRDESSKTPALIAANGFSAKLKLEAKSGEHGVSVHVEPAEMALAAVLVGPQQKPAALRLADLAIRGGRYDSNANTLDID